MFATTALEILGYVVTILVMLVGVLGCLIPIIPSTPIILIAAVVHRLVYGAEVGAQTWVLVVLGVITGLSFLLDGLASMVGAKKFGATWRGVTGAMVGGIVGLFFGIVGIFVGPFIGAVAFELLGQRDLRESSHAGVGAFVGILAGALGKLACCGVMMGLFVLDLLDWVG